MIYVCDKFLMGRNKYFTVFIFRFYYEQPVFCIVINVNDLTNRFTVVRYRKAHEIVERDFFLLCILYKPVFKKDCGTR